MKVMIAGDFCPLERVASFIDAGDYESVFGRVRGIVSSADYAIVNLECPVASADAKPIAKIGPNLCCDARGVDAIKYAGFKCITLANNHFYDYGEIGAKKTITTLDEKGIDYVGGGMCLKDAARVLYKEVSGSRLAIINCCEHEFSIATDSSAGSNPLNPIQQYYAIREAREVADYVLVIVHGGHEHWQLPSPRMMETYRFFIDAGADAVVNHHQHCFSGYEIYKEKPVFYGIGNFCFDNAEQRNSKWNEGFLVELVFDNTVSFNVIPYMQCTDKAEVRLLPMNSFRERLAELNAIIANPDKLIDTTEKYFELCAKQVNSIFEPSMNRFYLAGRYRDWFPSLISMKRKLRAENYICCESHRDKLIHWLTNTK